MPLDDEIEALYKLPLAEFTGARNALLKRAEPGADKARVRGLEKPVAAAWAVNQLYWQRRRTFDRLLDAAARLRAAHAQQLAGKRADVAAAERAHQDVLRAAADEARDLLRASGDAASPATMTAVTETLQAIPGRDDYGRLVKPLKPMGFEALAGLMSPGAAIAPFTPRRAESSDAAVVGKAPAGTKESARSAREARAARDAEHRAAEARRKELVVVEREWRDAQAAEREAQVALSRAEMSLARAQRERKALQEQLDEVIARADQLTSEMAGLRKAAERAAAERVRLEDRRDALKS